MGRVEINTVDYNSPPLFLKKVSNPSLSSPQNWEMRARACVWVAIKALLWAPTKRFPLMVTGGGKGGIYKGGHGRQSNVESRGGGGKRNK